MGNSGGTKVASIDAVDTGIPAYPALAPIVPGHGPALGAYLKALSPVVSEFTFANLFLFRRVHNYMLTRLPSGAVVIAGNDGGAPFFMSPAGFPAEGEARALMGSLQGAKCLTEQDAARAALYGFRVEEDRDNSDYLYSRREIASLSGRRFHRKKNLVNFFTGSYETETKPLTGEEVRSALDILDRWREGQDSPGDYEAAKEALGLLHELGLCGFIYYVGGRPAAYTLGEELNPETFAVHFEKGVPGIKGLAQFVTQSLAAALPERYALINREQDLGDEGLRKAKLGWRPVGFVRKFRAWP